MNAHADLFPKIPAIMKALPDPIDQMRFFELIQIIPSPAKAALNSGNLLNYRISEPRIMGYLRNNSMFAYGKADRAKTSATMREIWIRCGSSMIYSTVRWPSSARSKRSKKIE